MNLWSKFNYCIAIQNHDIALHVSRAETRITRQTDTQKDRCPKTGRRLDNPNNRCTRRGFLIRVIKGIFLVIMFVQSIFYLYHKVLTKYIMHEKCSSTNGYGTNFWKRPLQVKVEWFLSSNTECSVVVTSCAEAISLCSRPFKSSGTN